MRRRFWSRRSETEDICASALEETSLREAICAWKRSAVALALRAMPDTALPKPSTWRAKLPAKASRLDTAWVSAPWKVALASSSRSMMTPTSERSAELVALISETARWLVRSSAERKVPFLSSMRWAISVRRVPRLSATFSECSVRCG